MDFKIIRALTFNKLFPIVIVLFVSISCNNNNCSDYYVLDEVIFYNTDTEELSNIEFRGFEKGSNFEKLIDSTYVVSNIEESSSRDSRFYANLNKNIRSDLDYLVSFKSTGRSCKITEIVIDEEICYDGLIHKEYSKSIDGYLMNGKHFSCQTIKIFPIN